MKTYSEKLKDPRWQRKRLEIFQRDDFKCQICASKEDTLNVHHAFYTKGKDPWDYDADMLKTLCEDCHRQTELLKHQISMIIVDDIGQAAAIAFVKRYRESPCDLAVVLECLEGEMIGQMSHILVAQIQRGVLRAEKQ